MPRLVPGLFQAELSLYNAVPDEMSNAFAFGFGVSQVLFGGCPLAMLALPC